MAVLKKKKKASSDLMSLGDLFAPDEKYAEIDPEMTEEELVGSDGIYSFSKVADKLGIDTLAVYRHLNKEVEEGKDLYELYGLKKEESSQWRVRMKTFRPTFEWFKRNFPKGIPANLDREAFFQLRGIFRLKDVMAQGHLPYDYKEVTSFLKKESLSKEVSGCWVNEKNQWLCDFLDLLAWVFSRYRGIPLEDAKRQVRRLG